MKVKLEQWYPTKIEAIEAFERECGEAGIAPPQRYPPSVSGDSISNNTVAYPHHRCAAGIRNGHGWVYVDARKDAKVE